MKGDPKFDPTPFRITARKKGDLELTAEDGRVLRRNVIHVKKMQSSSAQKRAGPAEEAAEPGTVEDQEGNPTVEETVNTVMPAQQTSVRRARGGNEQQQPRRSARIIKAPKHYDMYVRLLESK